MTEPHPPPEDRKAAAREDVRFRCLRALANDPDLSQRGLARAAGVSLGAANALLNGLIEAGLVKIGDTGITPAWFRISYVLTRAGRAEQRSLATRYLARRRTERAALDAEIAALQVEAAQGTNPGA